MGADIHGWVEVCRWPYENDPDTDPQWVPAVRIDLFAKRNYNIFGYFFGVRGSAHSAKFPNRGLPEYVSDRVSSQHDDWGIDAHSESYCTFAEFYPAWRIYCEQEVDPTSEPSMHWQTVVNVMDEFAEQYKSEYVRLVVWFDN